MGTDMPAFREGDTPPDWCALRDFTVIDLARGERTGGARRAVKERLLVTRGAVQASFAGGSQVLREGQFLDLAPDAPAWTVLAARDAQIVRMSGRWGEELGGCGIFSAANVADPVNTGDPVAYEKTTSVDSHYHDCDEYWIVLEGRGTVVVGERFFDAGPGDSVAIGMGHHHDMATVSEPVKAVFFETTLEGLKRVGHLWNHTHGPAEPKPERL
jgi:mannose-6-phosphate isomerase-like protein (cupin superfamily)